MPRITTFPLSLEQLEDRRVLSAGPLSTLAVPQVPPTDPTAYLAAIQAEANALVQQASAQIQQRVVQAENLINTAAPAATNPTPTGSTSANVASRGASNAPVSTPTGTVAAIPVSAQGAGANQTSGNTGTGSADVDAQAPAAAVNPGAARLSASGTGADGGLTATPPATNLAATNGSAFTPTGNPAAPTDATSATMPVRDGALGGASPVGVAQPVVSFNPFDRASSAGPSVDLSGAGIRSMPVGGALAFAGASLLQTGADGQDEAVLQIAAPALLGADLLNGSGPQDAAAVDLGVRQFLGQLDDLGREVTRSLQETSVAVWVSVAALGVVAFEVARRRRQAQRALGFAFGAHGPADSWVPGLSGPLGSEES